MSIALSPYRLGKARELYNVFNFFNALSYTLLAGNIITLFAMRLEVSATFIGLLNALAYCAHFFLPLGKILCRKFSIIKIYSITWILRALLMTPLLFVPMAVSAGRHDLALILTLLGVSAFHFSRGIGLIANNPVLNELAVGADRGSYMTQIQIVNNAVGMFASFALAVLLGREPPLFLYAVIMVVGIAGGIFSGILLQKIPEPEEESGGNRTDFLKITRDAFSNPSIRDFIFILSLVALVSAIARSFIIVYGREVFLQGDGMVSLYTVFGGMGAMMMGIIIKFLVDRIGAKPLFLTGIIIGFLSLLPTVFFPAGAVRNTTTVILFLSFLNFIVNFGFLGAEGVAQTYFLALIPRGQMLDMGILYFLVFGIAGAGGSFMAGIFLDICSGLGLSTFMAFKVLFILLLAILALVLFFQKKLVALGALPFRGALEVMFSFKDLRAITLLDRLKKTSDTREEEVLLGALHDAPSRLAVKGLLERAKSPRLSTRLESLRALEALETLNEEAERALMDDLLNNPYTTAYISARILGNHGYFPAIPVLRELALSDDYMLAGEAMIALAKLHDEAFRPEIERLIAQTENPRLKIMGVEAFGIYGSPNSLSVLLDILKTSDPPPYLRDEVILAMAGILDIQNLFYPLLIRYLEDNSAAATLAQDEAEAAYELYISNQRGWKGKRKKSAAAGKQAKALQGAVSAYMLDLNGIPLSRWIMELPLEDEHTVAQIIMAEAVLDEELSAHDRLRLLAAHWASHELRILAKEK
jgi:HEAT repeat protein